MNGILVIDKPGAMTSRDVVNRVQDWFPRKTKIGHTGTLDPLATGVLVVCVGAATRLADFVQAMGKSYAARIRLGATSSTDDADGSVIEHREAVAPSRERIDECLAAFLGEIEQIPPAVSALKVDGHRAHDLVRRGIDVPLAARTVRVKAIRVVGYQWPHLDVEIVCGKGTYIRSIARDLGARLGIGGMVQTLRRTRVGPFEADRGIGLDASPEFVRTRLLPMTTVVSGLATVRISADDERRLRCGQKIAFPEGCSLPETSSEDVAILDERGELFGIGRVDGGLQPRIVLGGPPEARVSTTLPTMPSPESPNPPHSHGPRLN